MSKSLINIPGRTSTMSILRAELRRIESETGYVPVDWMTEVYDEAYEEYMAPDGFDWEGFAMHLSCVADNFIEFIRSHYRDLNNRF